MAPDPGARSVRGSQGSVEPFLWLLPGALGYAALSIFVGALLAAQAPGLTSASRAVSLGAGLMLDLALIPVLGATGAAVAASTAFLAGGATAVVPLSANQRLRVEGALAGATGRHFPAARRCPRVAPHAGEHMRVEVVSGAIARAGGGRALGRAPAAVRSTAARSSGRSSRWRWPRCGTFASRSSRTRGGRRLLPVRGSRAAQAVRSRGHGRTTTGPVLDERARRRSPGARACLRSGDMDVRSPSRRAPRHSPPLVRRRP